MAVSEHEGCLDASGIYEPLDATKEEIRLIEIQPIALGDENETIRCRLSIFNIGDAPPYTALSYRWGRPTPAFSILVNGQPLEIRENLYDFLCEYRSVDHHEPPTQYLWIDQISIEQANTQERNHQVKLMSAIYYNSQRVLIWLGSREQRFMDSDWTYCAVAKKFNAVKNCIVLRDLLHNPYFDRLWIVQEILLARRISVLVGNEWLDWSEMQVSALADLGSELRSTTPAFYLFQKTERNALYVADHDLEDCIHRFSSMSCSDPRDKVYALLGLTLDCDLEVDYTKSAQHVYLDAAQFVLGPFMGHKMKDPFALGAVVSLVHLAKQMDLPAESMHNLLEMLSALRSEIQDTLRPEDTEYQWCMAIGYDAVSDFVSGERWWYECRGKRHSFPAEDHKADLETKEKYSNGIPTSQIQSITRQKPRRWESLCHKFCIRIPQRRSKVARYPVTSEQVERNRKSIHSR